MAQLLDINLETNLSEFNTTVTDGGDLTQSATAALAGTAGGLRMNIDDTNVIYGQNNFTTLTSGDYRYRIYVNPKTLTMASGNNFTIVNAKSSTGSGRSRIVMNYNGSNYQIRAEARDDAGAYAVTSFYTITDAEHFIESRVEYGSNNATSDAIVTLWIDGVLQESKTGFILFDRTQPGMTRIGAVESIDAGTSGAFYLDEFVFNDDGSEIGPLPSSISGSNLSGNLRGNLAGGLK